MQAKGSQRILREGDGEFAGLWLLALVAVIKRQRVAHEAHVAPQRDIVSLHDVYNVCIDFLGAALRCCYYCRLGSLRIPFQL